MHILGWLAEIFCVKIDGVEGTAGCRLWFVAAAVSICWRCLRSARLELLRCCAWIFLLSVWARLAAAAMMASAGVTVGLVMYLCLKNTVAEILVALDVFDWTL